MNQEQQTQEEELILRKNRIRHKILKNQLILVSTLNLITFLSFVFAMAFYQWIWVQLEFERTNLDSKTYRFWVNLLYLKEDVPGSDYQHFSSAQQRICVSNIYCSACLYQFQFVGYLCFSIFSVAALIQVGEVFKMLFYIVKLGTIIQTRKYFRYIVAIGTYTIGLTLNAFSVNFMDNSKFNFGVSYWLCVGSLALFVAVIIYGQISLQKMVKQALIQNLLDKQKAARCENIMRINSSNPYIAQQESEQKLTL